MKLTCKRLRGRWLITATHNHQTKHVIAPSIGKALAQLRLHTLRTMEKAA